MKPMLLTAVLLTSCLSLSTMELRAEPNAMGRVFQDISQEGKAIVREQLTGSRDHRRTSREKAQELNARVPDLVRAGNTTELSNVFNDIRKIKQQNKKNFQDNFVDVVGKLSESDRNAVADRMQKTHDRMQKKRQERRQKSQSR